MKKNIETLLHFFGINTNPSYISWKKFVIAAHNYLSKRQKTLISEYKIGEYERFDWDQEKGTLVFSDNDQAVVRAKVQFVGSLSTKTKTWIWSWANETILENAKDRIHTIKEHGEENRYKQLVKNTWYGNESDGWDMTSITAYLLKAKGAYRISADTGFTYMVITDINWVKKKK